MSEEAIDNAWIVASYLTDADCLLASLGGLLTRNYEAENVEQSSAALLLCVGCYLGILILYLLGGSRARRMMSPQSLRTRILRGKQCHE